MIRLFRRSLRRFVGILAASVILSHPASGMADVIAQSGPDRVGLLEVYSSEGCSSCPPGESWVSRLMDDPGVWKKYVPVVFHVDYWDYLGWKDPLSQKRFSTRQRNYADFWDSASVYTPGFVLNGKEWRDWDRRDGSSLVSKGSPGFLKVEEAGSGAYKVTFAPVAAKDGGTIKGSFKVHAALLGFGIVTDVRAGENAGRKLKHDFAVIGFKEDKLTAAGKNGGRSGAWSRVVRIDPPSDFMKSGESKRLGIAVWVTRSSDPTPLQAAGGYLD